VDAAGGDGQVLVDGVFSRGFHLGAVGKAFGGVGEEAGVFGVVFVVVGPDEDGEVAGVLDDGFLETGEGSVALAVDKGHVDVEDAEEAVGRVFDAGGLSLGGPGHSAGDGYFGEGGGVGEDGFWDAGDAGYEVCEVLFVASVGPVT